MKLSERMKQYEKQYEKVIPTSDEIIVRIDGHKFSKFTKGFNKPFDEIFQLAMVETTKDLVERFQAYTGYTQSDEISLYIPKLDIKDFVHIFGGRTQKIASLIAAYCTLRFNYHFETIANDFYEKYIDVDIEKYKKKFNTGYFDARVFGVPNKEEVLNAFMFRARDCERNSKQQFARSYCSHQELMNKNTDEQIEYCKQRTGMDWNVIPDNFKYGIFIKKLLYSKKVNGINIERTKIIALVKDLTDFNDENLKFVTSKYLED